MLALTSSGRWFNSLISFLRMAYLCYNVITTQIAVCAQPSGQSAGESKRQCYIFIPLCSSACFSFQLELMGRSNCTKLFLNWERYIGRDEKGSIFFLINENCLSNPKTLVLPSLLWLWCMLWQSYTITAISIFPYI